ncbi:MAG: class I SAM-dependent methyltransferase [Burkholderiaceae bacterium]
MSNDPTTQVIPSGVSPDAARLLERAYALDGAESSRALYRDWAETYDETMLQGLRYLSPGKVADLLEAHLPDRTAAVLDIGCGTGLCGHGLAAHGFTTIDGLDVSPEMMEVAARLGAYRHFLAADLNQPLDIASDSYAGMSCSGTFTHGHVDARCLDELFRVLAPGAPFAFTVKREVWESLGFKDKLAALIEGGRIVQRAWQLDCHYSSSAQPDGVFCVYAKV